MTLVSTTTTNRGTSRYICALSSSSPKRKHLVQDYDLRAMKSFTEEDGNRDALLFPSFEDKTEACFSSSRELMTDTTTSDSDSDDGMQDEMAALADIEQNLRNELENAAEIIKTISSLDKSNKNDNNNINLLWV